MGKRRLRSRIGKAMREAAARSREVASQAQTKASNLDGPSPNPMTNLILTDIALRGGGRILRQGVERVLLGTKYDQNQAEKIVEGRTIGQAMVGAALARVATRSVPGAIVVGGGLLAKTVYDRTRNRRRVRAEGRKEVAKQADNA